MVKQGRTKKPKHPKHGGKRPNAGRPATGKKSATKTFSLPIDILEKLSTLKRGEASALMTQLLEEYFTANPTQE
jgi:hypothetical protein